MRTANPSRRIPFTGPLDRSIPRTGLTDEQLIEVFGIADIEETQDNGDESAEEQLTENDVLLQ